MIAIAMHAGLSVCVAGYIMTVAIMMTSTRASDGAHVVTSQFSPPLARYVLCTAAYNGTVPGPMIRVVLGDTVELTLVNPAESLHKHSIDLHAVEGPGGGASLTQILPGESSTFRFKGWC